MFTYEGEDIFVIDGHIHMWDASEENIKTTGGKQFIDCFYDYHTGFTPEDKQWTYEEYEKYGVDRLTDDFFGNGVVDMGIFQPTHLKEFYHEGFNTVERLMEVKAQYPERFLVNGRFDPREGDEGMAELVRQKEEYDIQGAKVYTAEWKDDSKGWRLDSDKSFEFLEKCADLGIKNIHAHKGPTIRPLNKDAFDVGDVDLAASSFPDLNFVVEHVGLPRLDDFCWIAAQEPNVYGGLAVAAPLAVHRQKKFGEIMGELLFWLGEDRLLFGSDYALWNPDWLVKTFLESELTDEQQAEYGVDFDLEAKKKILGENAAELYDIDIEQKKRDLELDAASEKYDLASMYSNNTGGAVADD